VHVPLSSHTRRDPNATLFVRQPTGEHADGRHFESDPVRTSRRYGSTATPNRILNQALRGGLRVRSLEPDLDGVLIEVAYKSERVARRELPPLLQRAARAKNGVVGRVLEPVDQQLWPSRVG
jgi:hypothetical protein